MVTKSIVSLVTAALLSVMLVWSLPWVDTVAAQEGVNPEVTSIVEIGQKGTQPFPYDTPDMKVLFEEMTLVWLQGETYAYAITACAGNGLNNIKSPTDGPMVLIPNAGDLSVEGSNVSMKLTPDGEITFIPRTQGQRIRVPVDVGDKVAGEEVLSLSLAEAMELMAEGKLVWTAKHHGPYGNGHGLPGHIAACDPLYVNRTR